MKSLRSNAPRVLLIASLLAVWASCVFSLSARRRNSTRQHLKPAAVAAAEDSGNAWHCDTVAADTAMVRFAGYSKTLRAVRESVFLTNLTDSTDVEGVMFRIKYFDLKGRLLHEVRHELSTDIPPGETRKLDFPTWDRQFTFYYVKSPKPRVSAIPYSVKIFPDTLLLSPVTSVNP